MTTGTRTLRKDAELNRQRLIEAARELFATHGLDVTLNDVAHHAGVGVGTAYRRFANKEALIDALFEERLQEVAAAAAEALADPDAWHGFVAFTETALRMQMEDRGLKDIMSNPALGEQRVKEARDRIGPLVDSIVERAKEQGRLRPDFQGSDQVFLTLALGAVADTTRNTRPELYRRYLTMFLDGLSTNRGPLTPLPVEALSADQTHEAMVTSSRPSRATER